MTRKEQALIIIGSVVVLATAGAGYAFYLSIYCGSDHSGWQLHLYQWWPFLTALAAVFYPLRRIHTDTGFAEFGLIGVLAVAMPMGYVIGRYFFF